MKPRSTEHGLLHVGHYSEDGSKIRKLCLVDEDGDPVDEPWKVLSVRQPWAWAIVEAGKDVENRSRPTKHRGPLAIHVSTFHKWHEIAVDAQSMSGLIRQTSLTRGDLEKSLGCVIGIVDVVDCIRDSSSRWAIPGQWHWVLDNQRRVRPVPIVGRLGIFEREIELEELKR